MDHERAFWQAIREEPADDAHRLIYADWLEEQGGADRAARANFIRAQCRLAALPADDPIRGDLEDEAADLLAEREREWTQPLHGLAEDWQFSRGFVENITIRGEDFLTHAEHLYACFPLRAIHLLIGPKDIPRLAACPFLQFVETLDFRRCHLIDRSLQQLLTSPYLNRLHALDLTGNGITTLGMQSLVHSSLFPRLRRLDLSRNLGVGDKAVHLLARSSQAESLEELGLAATNATLEGLQELFQSPHLPRLTNLNVAHTRSWWEAQLTSPLRIWAESKLLGQLRCLDLSEDVHPDSLRVLLDSLRAAHLQTLHLRSIRAERTDAKRLADCPHLANLTTLDLRKNSLGAEGAQILADSPHLASLTHLDVSSNNIRDTGAKALAESPHLRRLMELNLARNGIGGPGLQALAGSSNLRHVATLNLAANFIGADSVRALAESDHLSRLSWLDLSDACLDEISARTLASEKLVRLTTLLLQKNQLGDGGAKALAQSPHLRRLATLDLNDNRIGKAGAEALAAAPFWRRMRKLDLRGNIFTDTQEALLRGRFAEAVSL